MKIVNQFLLTLLLALNLGCASSPACDLTKQITDWIPWEAEVNRIICEEAALCSGDPDEGVGYGFTTACYQEGDTPCQAAIKIMERHKAESPQSSSDTDIKKDDTTKKERLKQTIGVEPWVAEVYRILCDEAKVCTGKYTIEAVHWSLAVYGYRSVPDSLVRWPHPGDIIVLYDPHIYLYLCVKTWDDRFGFANCVMGSVGFFSSLYHKGLTPREAVDAIVARRAQNIK